MFRLIACAVLVASLPTVSQAQGLTLNVVQESIELKPSDILEAKQEFQEGRPIVVIKLGPDAAKRFGDITGRNLRKTMQLVAGDRILTSPIIQTPISGGTVVITGSFTIGEAIELARKIKP
jgi:preprotein translocase subunit SecD